MRLNLHTFSIPYIFKVFSASVMDGHVLTIVMSLLYWLTGIALKLYLDFRISNRSYCCRYFLTVGLLIFKALLISVKVLYFSIALISCSFDAFVEASKEEQCFK